MTTKQSLTIRKSSQTMIVLGDYEVSINNGKFQSVGLSNLACDNQICASSLEDLNAISVLIRMAKAEYFKLLDNGEKRQQIETLRLSLSIIDSLIEEARTSDNISAMGKLGIQRHTLTTDLELYESLSDLYKLANW